MQTRPHPDPRRGAHRVSRRRARRRRARRARSAACGRRLQRAHGSRCSARGRPPAEPFDLLLDMAPIDRLEKMLEAADAPPSRTWSSFGGFRALAAAIVLLVLGGAIGFGLSRTLAPTEVAEAPGWRAVVADYVALYTPETFALAPADPEAYAPRLKVVGDGLGLDLDAGDGRAPRPRPQGRDPLPRMTASRSDRSRISRPNTVPSPSASSRTAARMRRSPSRSAAA